MINSMIDLEYPRIQFTTNIIEYYETEIFKHKRSPITQNTMTTRNRDTASSRVPRPHMIFWGTIFQDVSMILHFSNMIITERSEGKVLSSLKSSYVRNKMNGMVE